MLAEFASVVDGVCCAVELQREIAMRNHDVPKERRIEAGRYREAIKWVDEAVFERPRLLFVTRVPLAQQVRHP
jgi:hypothetical protein